MLPDQFIVPKIICAVTIIIAAFPRWSRTFEEIRKNDASRLLESAKMLNGYPARSIVYRLPTIIEIQVIASEGLGGSP